MKSLSLVYASSLFSLCEEENKTESVLYNLLDVYKIFEDNQDYSTLLDSPIVPVSERISLIEEAFSDCDEYVLNFIKILCEKKSTHMIFDCVKQYEKLYNKKNNIVAVTVITAAEISDALKEKLCLKLEKDLRKKVTVEYRTDKSLIGGIIVRTENSQTDASIRARLDDIKTQLSCVKLYN